MLFANASPSRPATVVARWLLRLAVTGAATAVPPAFCAHPMLTEDTGTQGKGRFELELAFERVREGDASALEFGPQLSGGLLDNLDLIVRPTWIDLRGSIGSIRGLGDTALDMKWRFHEDGPWSFGLRAGLDVPTGNESRGLGTGEIGYHGVLIVTYQIKLLTISANLGVLHAGDIPLQRRDLALASVGVVWEAGEGLKLTAEVDTASNPDFERSTWPTVARFGIICTLDKYWDVDVGYQTRLNHAAPDSAILVGATLRW